MGQIYLLVFKRLYSLEMFRWMNLVLASRPFSGVHKAVHCASCGFDMWLHFIGCSYFFVCSDSCFSVNISPDLLWLRYYISSVHVAFHCCVRSRWKPLHAITFDRHCHELNDSQEEGRERDSSRFVTATNQCYKKYISWFPVRDEVEDLLNVWLPWCWWRATGGDVLVPVLFPFATLGIPTAAQQTRRHSNILVKKMAQHYNLCDKGVHKEPCKTSWQQD